MSWTRFIVASDLHGDMGDGRSVEALRKFIAHWKPTLRIFSGDLWDFRPLRGGASDDERRESMRADYLAGMDFLKEFRPQHFLRGNHDERLWHLHERGVGVASDFAGELIARAEDELKRLRCSMLPYHKRDGVLRVGHLKVLHGFHSGIYAVRHTALTYGASIIGHIHAVDEHAIPGLERRVCRAIGCLCKLDMEYCARTPSTLRWSHGFAYGVLNQKTGAYHVWQAEEVNGSWLVASDTMTL